MAEGLIIWGEFVIEGFLSEPKSGGATILFRFKKRTQNLDSTIHAFSGVAGILRREIV